MNFIYQILIAAALIAVMIIVRVFANRAALHGRLDCTHAGSKCGETICSHSGEKKRSTCDAP